MLVPAVTLLLSLLFIIVIIDHYLLSFIFVRACKPKILAMQGQKSKYVWTKDDSRALATCFIGGKEKISKIVTEFHDAHQKIPKTQINDNARAMTVYERRAGDTRKYWYLTKESKAEYDIQVCL